MARSLNTGRLHALTEAGAVAREATARALAELDETDWGVLHDTHWPGRKRRRLDHVAVGPGGVFVIHSLNWSGTVMVEGGVLRQDGRPRQKPVAEVAAAVRAVEKLVPTVPVHGVVCLAKDAPVVGRAGGVIVRSSANVCEMLTKRPAALETPEVWRLTSMLQERIGTTDLRGQMPAADAPRAETRSGVVRLVAGLVMIAALIGALQLGLFSRVGSAVSDFVVDVTTEDPLPETPKDPLLKKLKKKQKDNKQEKKKKQKDNKQEKKKTQG